MDITTFAAPPPLGSALPGNLYADLTSRSLWLGVDPAVDPAGSVLVSDIMGLMDEIASAEARANAYTDTGLLTRAPLSHTHTAAQITNFSAAVTTVVAGIPGFNWVTGMVLMYAGSLADIGVGNLAGWVLCDGSNGAPDLRDRFIIGAGNKPVGNKNTPINFNVSDAGAHAHTVDGTAISAAQMPSHSHTITVSGTASGTTGTESALHTHATQTPLTGGVAGGGFGGSLSGVTGINTGTESANHTHSFSVAIVASGSAAATGGGATHTHTMQSAGTHNHVVTAAQIRDTVPYYALAFIYKL